MHEPSRRVELRAGASKPRSSPEFRTEMNAAMAHAGDVDRVEEDERGDGERRRIDVHEPARVIGERASEVRERAGVRNDLQPRAEEGEPVAAERARDVRVLAARLLAERRRKKHGVRGGGGEHRGREHDVAEDHARSREHPHLAGHFENPCADQDAEQSRVGLDRAEVAAQVGGHAETVTYEPTFSPRGMLPFVSASDARDRPASSSISSSGVAIEYASLPASIRTIARSSIVQPFWIGGCAQYASCSFAL